MKMRRALVASGGLLALAAGLAGGPARGQPPADEPTRQVADLFESARPHLEAVMGCRLLGNVQFRPITAEQFQQLPEPDLEAYLGWHFADLDARGRQQAVRAVRKARGDAAIARYAEGSGVIYVLPGQQAVLAHWDERLSGAAAPAFLQLALVQEAARQVLDSRYNLGRLRAACRSPEEHQVLQAVVEGRALWAAREVARRLGTQDHVPPLAERLRHVPDPARDPGLRAAVQTALRQEYWACDRGLAFFAYLEEHGVKDAERRAFGKLPRQVRWVEEPALYLRADQPGRPDLAAVLGRLQALPPQDGWRPAQQPWSPEMVGQAAALLGARERAEKVVASWEDGRSLLWTDPADGRRMVAVSLVRHTTTAGARSYFGFALDMQRKQDELLAPGCAGVIRVVQSRAGGLQLPGLEEGARFDRLLQFGQAGDAAPQCIMLGRAGDLVVEVSWHGQAPDTAWTELVIRAVLGDAPR
jgi:hypothetical protein